MSGQTPGQDGGRIDLQDLLFGVFLVAVAAAATAATWKLRIGIAGNMGPGYMPRMIVVGIAGFGLYFIVRGLLRPFHAIEPVRLRGVIGILASVAVFAMLAPTAGLAIATLATIVVAGFASVETKFVENLLFGVAIAAGAVLLFVKALNLPVPAWPW